MSLIYLQRDQFLSHEVHYPHYLAPPCFYSSVDWTNETLAQGFVDTVGSIEHSTHTGGIFSGVQFATSLLDATKSYTWNFNHRVDKHVVDF